MATPNSSEGEELRNIRFENEQLDALGIETLTLSKLRKKLSAKQLSKPERVDFYQLILITSGQGVHTVDFVEWLLTEGTLILIRPGQVQQWHPNESLSGHIILIEPSTLPFANALITAREVEFLTLFNWQTCSQLPDDILKNTRDSFLRLGSDINRFDDSELDISLIRYELLAILLRLARWQRDKVNTKTILRPGYEKYQQFISLLEGSFCQEHSLQYYAKRLGYSNSTLSRACLSVEGRSGKVVIDRRIALEGQRMLAHSSASVAEVAHYLGFSEPTNFIKFFKRLTGTTPSDFRLKKTV